MSSVLRKQPLQPSATTELVQWWKAELREWYGGISKDRVATDDVVADITVVREGLLLSEKKFGPFSIADIRTSAADALGKRGLPKSVTLALAQGRFLRRKLADHRIPLARAQKMAELDVETQTPFKLHDVYVLFADQQLSEEGSHYYLARRDILDPVLDELQRNGRDLSALVFEEGGRSRSASGFMTVGLRRRRAVSLRAARGRIFGLACIVLIALIGHNVNVALASASTSVDSAIETTEPKAKEARERFKAQSAFLDRIEALHAEQNAYTPVAKLLEELSFVLPDTTYLTNVSVRQGKVKITGFSTNAAELIALVESSKVFANPKFVSAVVKVPDRKGEQFDLEAELEHAG